MGVRFVVDRDYLRKLAQAAGAMTGSNPLLPIIRDILVKLEGEKLSLLATDLDNAIVVEGKVSGEGEGVFAVPAKEFIDELGSMPPEPLTIVHDSEKQVISINISTGAFHLHVDDPADFPRVPQVEEGEPVCELSSLMLRNIIEYTFFAMSKDEDVNKAFAGLRFELSSERCDFVATDGTRLSLLRTTKVRATREARFTVPRRTIQTLRTTLPKKEDIPVRIYFSENHASFRYTMEDTGAGATLIARLIDVPFPDYESVVPSGYSNAMVVDSEQLEAVLRRVGGVTSKRTHAVKFSLYPEQVVVSGEDPDTGSRGEERLAVTYQGEPMTIGFNYRFLLEALDAIPVSAVRMEFGSPTSACVLRPAEEIAEGELVILVMPLILSEA